MAFKRLNRDIKGFEEREASVKQNLMNSQKMLDQMKENAQKSAELIFSPYPDRKVKWI